MAKRSQSGSATPASNAAAEAQPKKIEIHLSELAEFALNASKNPTSAIIQAAIIAKRKLDEQFGLNNRQAHAQSLNPNSFGRFGGANIIGTSLDEKQVGGKGTGQLAIVVYVQDKPSDKDAPGDAMIPSEIDGIPTDIVHVGVATPHGSCGSVVGSDTEYGTIGCYVTFKGENVPYIMSNWHAMAYPQAAVGLPVKDAAFKKIGTLTHWLAPTPGVDNHFDIALAKADAKNVTSCLVTGSPMPLSEIRSALNAGRTISVKKMGTATGLTTGRLFAITSVIIDYSNWGLTNCRFVEQLAIKGDAATFSQLADSGSLVVSADGHPVGLLHSGAGNISYATPIEHVINKANLGKIG